MPTGCALPMADSDGAAEIIYQVAVPSAVVQILRIVQCLRKGGKYGDRVDKAVKGSGFDPDNEIDELTFKRELVDIRRWIRRIIGIEATIRPQVEIVYPGFNATVCTVA